jgi:membrane-bound lytic murein transglycosylase MltF
MTKFMNHMKETGKLAELQKKWFGETYDLPTERSPARNSSISWPVCKFLRRATAAC